MVEPVEHSQMLEATAYWTAAVRAQESQRVDRLFDDPWAARLAGADGMAWIEQRTPQAVTPMVLRTRYFDDFLQRIVDEHGIRQIVMVAAGLDTRAYRLAWPDGLVCYELEQPAVLAHKERVLQEAAAVPTCIRRSVGVNLIGHWEAALVDAGFAVEQPSGWLLEGFLFYLSNEHLADVLARALSLAVSGSHIGFDVINSATLTSPLTQAWVQMQADAGAPWLGALDDPREFLAQRGWTAALTAPGASDANHGRWPYPVLPVDMLGVPHLWYVTGYKEQPR